MTLKNKITGEEIFIHHDNKERLHELVKQLVPRERINPMLEGCFISLGLHIAGWWCIYYLDGDYSAKGGILFREHRLDKDVYEVVA
jgi:hypothetical protein